MGRPLKIEIKAPAVTYIERTVANTDKGVCIANHAAGFATKGHVEEMLCGIRHWCDAHEMNFAALDRGGFQRYSTNVEKARLAEKQTHYSNRFGPVLLDDTLEDDE